MIREHENTVKLRDVTVAQLQSDVSRYKAMLDDVVTNSEGYLATSSAKLQSSKDKAKRLQASFDSLTAENRSLAAQIEDLKDVIAANKVKNRKLMTRQSINDLMLDVADHQTC